MSVTAVVLIKARTDQINELAQVLSNIHGVTDVYSVAGRYDLVAIVQAQRNEDLAQIISVDMHKAAGIVDSETLIAFRTFRNDDVHAGFALGQND